MNACGALAGITVIDLSRLLPGPYCSMILADHGARVIGIEDRKYEAEGLMVATISRNKEHMALDLKSEAGRRIFFQLAAKADVVLEGFRPGVVDRLGVDFAAVRAVRPDIVYCSLTGYGQTGPFRDRAGHDVNYLGYAGVLDLIGYADQPPAIPGVQIADMVGGLNAALGILLALLVRERTGEGQYIDIAMTDAMLGMMPVALLMRQLLGAAPQRGAGMLAHRYACYNTYATKDDRYIGVGCVEQRFWEKLCRFLEMPELIPRQYDEAHRTDTIARLRRKFKARTLEEWELAMQGLDICCGAVRTLDEALDAELFRARGMLHRWPLPGGGDQTDIGIPIKLTATPGALRTPPVRFGQHTAAILEELGYTTDDVARLAAQGVI
jgi:crotonobetainyl-CoA:carnitine CoA-transferase CaiB-like acyl-CoA transferase